MRSVLGVLWKDWCWSWNSNTLATWCEELTHLKRPWCWEGLGGGGEGDDRGWDGWMASPTWWMWLWVDSGSWWWTGRPGVLWFMGLQRVWYDWATKLNWTKLYVIQISPQFFKCWKKNNNTKIPGLGRFPGGRHGNPSRYSCLENPHGQRSLVGYSRWDQKELDTTEQLSMCTHTHTNLEEGRDWQFQQTQTDSDGQRSLASCNPWGHKESDTT